MSQLPSAGDFDPLAFHEAGHATAMIANGISFRYITIRARARGLDGNTRAYRTRMQLGDTWGLILAAGAAAELYAEALARGFRGEEAHLEAGIRLVTEPQWTLYPELIRAHDQRRDAGATAVGFVVEQWAAVDALARALVASPRALTHADALAVVAPHLRR